MRQTLVVLLVLGFTHLASGAGLRDFSGRWVGSRTELVGGVNYLFSQRTTFRYAAGGSLRGDSTLVSGGFTFKVKAEYASNGSYSALMTRGGQVVAITSGTWRLSGKVVRVRAVSRTVAGTQRANASLQLASPKKLVAISNTSVGTVAITLRKR